MAQQPRKINQSAKLHQHLSSSDIEYQRHLLNAHRNYEKYLAASKARAGFNVDGSFNGYDGY